MQRLRRDEVEETKSKRSRFVNGNTDAMTAYLNEKQSEQQIMLMKRHYLH